MYLRTQAPDFNVSAGGLECGFRLPLLGYTQRSSIPSSGHVYTLLVAVSKYKTSRRSRHRSLAPVSVRSFKVGRIAFQTPAGKKYMYSEMEKEEGRRNERGCGGKGRRTRTHGGN